MVGAGPVLSSRHLGESIVDKLGRAEVRPVPQTCVLAVCWAALVTWAAGSEVGSCQMAPFQAVHGSDPAAQSHWAAPSCKDGRAGFAFYVQCVHLLLDNKTPSSHGPSPRLLLSLCCKLFACRDRGGLHGYFTGMEGPARHSQLATSFLCSRKPPTHEG